MGIAAAIPALAQELDQIELVPLSDNRVLMILATRDRMVRNRVVTLDEPASPDELASVRNYVNRNFAGWQLGAARRELLRRMLEDRELYDAALRKLQTLYRKGLLEGDTSPEVHMEGASNLLGLDLHLTRETPARFAARARGKAASDRDARPVPGTAAGRTGGACGSGRGAPGHEGSGVDRHDGAIGERPAGQSGGLGPMRMHYERAMAAVFETSRALENAQL